MKVRRGRRERGRDRKCHGRASLSRPLVSSLGPLTSLNSFPLFFTSEDISGRCRGGPLSKWGWSGRDRFVMTFSDVFLPVPFLASPFDLHRNVNSRPGHSLVNLSHQISKKKLRIKRCQGIRKRMHMVFGEWNRKTRPRRRNSFRMDDCDRIR